MSRSALLLVVAPLVLLAGCGGGESSEITCTEVPAPAPETRIEPRPTAPLDPDRTYTVTMQTNCGSFTITLDQRQSPNAAASMYSLVQKGFYDGTTFHRILPGFRIQGGDPSATGNEGPGYTTIDEPPTDASYRYGTVAMAKSGGDATGTGGSQFFIVTGQDAGYPPEYAVVGHLSDGLEVVDAIGQLGGPDELPTQVVEIEKATAAES